MRPTGEIRVLVTGVLGASRQVMPSRTCASTISPALS